MMFVSYISCWYIHENAVSSTFKFYYLLLSFLHYNERSKYGHDVTRNPLILLNIIAFKLDARWKFFPTDMP